MGKNATESSSKHPIKCVCVCEREMVKTSNKVSWNESDKNARRDKITVVPKLYERCVYYMCVCVRVRVSMKLTHPKKDSPRHRHHHRHASSLPY